MNVSDMSRRGASGRPSTAALSLDTRTDHASRGDRRAIKSFVTLCLEPGAIILAASGSGYDAAELNAPFESYQDFGHNHWHNSLIWGEGIHDVAIFGPGLICGRGLSRGEVAKQGLPRADAPGAADSEW